ncbi:MAG: hypothetical protein ACK8QZ_04105 [Anaerolineales bacterium]
MKKTLLLVTSFMLALAFLGIGAVYAQGTTPTQYGPLHDFMERALANKLNLTEIQVEQELASGKTMAQIALDHGIAPADLPTFLKEVHQLALNEAVKAGVITQAQADWMLQHAQGFGYRYGYRYGMGTCQSGFGCGLGAMFWQGSNTQGNYGYGFGGGMMGRGRR